MYYRCFIAREIRREEAERGSSRGVLTVSTLGSWLPGRRFEYSATDPRVPPVTAVSSHSSTATLDAANTQLARHTNNSPYIIALHLRSKRAIITIGNNTFRRHCGIRTVLWGRRRDKTDKICLNDRRRCASRLRSFTWLHSMSLSSRNAVEICAELVFCCKPKCSNTPDTLFDLPKGWEGLNPAAGWGRPPQWW